MDRGAEKISKTKDENFEAIDYVKLGRDIRPLLQGFAFIKMSQSVVLGKKKLSSLSLTDIYPVDQSYKRLGYASPPKTYQFDIFPLSISNKPN